MRICYLRQALERQKTPRNRAENANLVWKCFPTATPKTTGSPNGILGHFEGSFGPSGGVPGAPAEMVILGFKFDAQKWALARHQK